MKRFRKVYLEISNICNLHCSFCPGTKRKSHAMGEAEFTAILQKLQPFTDYLYFHLMGEPLLHPKLGDFLRIAGDIGFKVILTTNGTLLSRCSDILLQSDTLYKISISLHSFEANVDNGDFEEYLDSCFAFCSAAASCGKIAVMRLWNKGGDDKLNEIGRASCRERV